MLKNLFGRRRKPEPAASIDSPFRTATFDEYLTWVKGRMAQGGAPIGHMNFAWEPRWYLTGTRDFRLGGESRDYAMSIIVLSGVRHIGGSLGWNKLLYMDNFRFIGQKAGFLIYSNPEFLDIPGIPEFIKKHAARDEEFREKHGYHTRPPATDSDLWPHHKK